MLLPEFHHIWALKNVKWLWSPLLLLNSDNVLLICMFHSRGLNHKINSLHKRALRITFSDNDLTFEDLLIKDNSVSVHHRNLQLLATEMFKSYNCLSPNIINEIFEHNTSTYNLRNRNFYWSRKVNSVYNGT